MVFRFTAYAQAKLKTGRLPKLPESADLIHEWYVTAFVHSRRKHFMTTNAATLYTVISLGAGVPSDSEYFGMIFRELAEQTAADGLEFPYRRFIAPASGEVALAATANRSVLGSMNDFLMQAEHFLAHESVRAASSRINESPMSYLGMESPADALRNFRV
jgi:hypothetical protein